MADLAQRYEIHPNQIYEWRKQLIGQAARAFESSGGNGAALRDRGIEKLHAKISALILGSSLRTERDLTQEVRKMSAPDRRRPVDGEEPQPRSGGVRAARDRALWRLSLAAACQRRGSRADALHPFATCRNAGARGLRLAAVSGLGCERRQRPARRHRGGEPCMRSQDGLCLGDSRADGPARCDLPAGRKAVRLAARVPPMIAFEPGSDQRPIVMTPRRYLAALTLFLLPAISVELLTGDTSLVNFLNPVAFIVLTLTYGGALLIRETVVRWGKGFASVLVLAAGYGMVNEGLGSKGFFDPRFYAVVENGLEGFGRWFGVNVPWALSISIFHATFSIIVPLVIVSAIFPGPERWIGNRLYAALMVAFAAVIAFSFEVLSPTMPHYYYNEGPGPLALVLALIALDILIAWKLPTLPPRRWRLRLPAPALFALGAVYAFAFVPSSVIARAAGSPVAAVAFYLALFVALPIWLLFRLPEPSSRGKVGLAAGLLVPVLTLGRGAGPGSILAAIVVVALVIIALVRGGRSASPVAATE